MNDLKLYVLIKDSIAPGNAIVAAAHAQGVCERDFGAVDTFVEWKRESFRVAICAVNEKEWERAKLESSYAVITESTLDNAEVALVFCPRYEWPRAFKFFRKWK